MVQVNPGANDGPQPPPTEEEERKSREVNDEVQPTEKPGHDHTEDR
jgi:hypothetical protein